MQLQTDRPYLSESRSLSVKSLSNNQLQQQQQQEEVSNLQPQTTTANKGNIDFPKKSFRLKQNPSKQRKQFEVYEDNQDNEQSDSAQTKTDVGDVAQAATSSVKFEPPSIFQTSYNPNQSSLQQPGQKGFSKLNLPTQSPLPGIYKQYLPNLIKNQLSDQSQTTYAFNQQLVSSYDPVTKKVQNKYGKQDPSQFNAKDAEQYSLRGALRPDVSFLKEKTIADKRAKSNNQGQDQHQNIIQSNNQNIATILTTGDKNQDELLIATMGLKNIGASLINLPQTLEELKVLLQTKYKSEFQKFQKTDEEERFFEKYLEEQFKATDLLHNRKHGITLQEYAMNLTNEQQNVQDKKLKSWTQKLLLNEKSQGQKKMFNIQENKQGKDIQQLEKEPPMINTQPDKLNLVSNSIMRKYKNETLQNLAKLDDKSLHSVEKGQQSNMLKTFMKIPNKKGRNLQQMEMKTIDNLNLPSTANNFNQTFFQNLLLTERAQQQSPLLMQVNSSQGSPQIQKQPNLINNQLQSLGNPSSRQDAILLMAWLEKMLILLQKEFQTNTEQKEKVYFPILQLVFNIGIKEICRQVSVQCVERGTVLKKIFQAYIELIQVLNANFQLKKKEIKKDFAEKLDKYIQAYEDQLNFYKNELAQSQQSCEKMKKDLLEHEFRLNQQNILITKLKKKNLVLDQDLNSQKKKAKFLEKENLELKNKINELAERYGEDMSSIEEGEVEQRKRLELVERELEQEKDWNEVPDKEIEEIPDIEIIKEEDRGTDMAGFELYLRMVFGERAYTVETQTEKIIKKHVKVGINPEKLGILRDRQTYIDPNLVQVGIGTGDQTIIDHKNQSKQLSDVFEDSSEYQTSENESIQSEIINYDDIEELMNFARSGYKLELIAQKRSKSQEQLSRVDDDDNLNQQARRKSSFQMINKQQKQIQKMQMERRQTINGNQKRRNTKVNVFDLIGKRVKARIKGIINSQQLESVIKAALPDLYNKIIKDLDISAKDVETLNKEIHKKTLLAKQQSKLNRQNAKKFNKANDKADAFEIENYVMKESMNDLLKLNQEERNIVQEIMRNLDKDSTQQNNNNNAGSVSNSKLFTELRKKIMTLSDKLNQSRKKTLNEYIKYDPLFNDESNANANNNEEGDNQQYRLEYTNTMNTDQLDRIDDEEANNRNDNENEDNERIQTGNTSNQRTRYQNVQHRFNKKKKGETKFQLFNIGGKKSLQVKRGPHPAYVILKKVQNRDKKSKEINIPKKMLLRIIYQVYQEKAGFDIVEFKQAIEQVANSSGANFNPQIQQNQATSNLNQQQQQQQSQTTLLEYLYDKFMNKYGFKNVAEKKFAQVLGACIDYKDTLPRIRLFGRFLEVYNELNSNNYNRLQEMIETFISQVLNFKFDDDDEVVYLPFIQRMKIIVSSDLQKANKHLKGIKEAVDFDQYAEFVIDNYNFLQQEREQQIRDVYLSVDLNNDGLLSLQEFQLLMKVFHYRSAKDIWKLFEEYAENGLDDQNPYVKYLTIDQFSQMSLDKDFFNPKLQLNFLKTKNIEQDFKNVTENLGNIISVLKQRLILIEYDDDIEYMELLENFKTQIQVPYSTRVGWLTFRVIDEIIKRLFMKKLSDMYMPLDIKQFDIKVKPSPNVLALAPNNLFDSL